MANTTWPILDFQKLEKTLETVQQFTQIAGKIRLKKMPWLNHSWNVTLYVSSRGLSTAAMPYEGGNFQLEFDFINHKLIFTTSRGGEEIISLQQKSIAGFYAEVLEKLKTLGIEVSIYARPNEIEPSIPFAENTTPCQYDGEQMNLYYQALVKINCLFNEFRAAFTGKSSPVHLFWGGFDLAVTRFSGRTAPAHPGGMPHMPLRVMQEAYSHEVSSAGFWAGSADFPFPVFYAYCYPTPDQFKSEQIKPETAFYSEEMGEFLLKYEDVISAADSEKTLRDFLETTYMAAAKTGNWDIKALEFCFKP